MTNPTNESINRFIFSLYHEPMPDYDWTEAKIKEIVEAEIAELQSALRDTVTTLKKAKIEIDREAEDVGACDHASNYCSCDLFELKGLIDTILASPTIKKLTEKENG